MSILTKPYEVSLWDDVWDGSCFREKRLCVIGSNEMASQGRILEPMLTRNTNGTKKFSFKLYKKYIDNITGQEVDNPFYDWLVSERKIKLYCDNQWHDFVIKNIAEDSTNFLYSYQLEDALVQELSKNGFGVVLDAEQLNNSGSAKELAAKVLKDTDWTVSEDSEVFVQTIEEALVYLTIVKSGGITATRIKDQDPNELTKGVQDYATTVTIPQGSTILGFYSSCVNKPHRFQFVYVEDVNNITIDESRIITNKDCQYYIDFANPNDSYVPAEGFAEDCGFYLPQGVNTTTSEDGVFISAKYRGRRYGFSQISKFIPELNRYVQVYNKDGETYYGYQNDEYKSPALIQNIITNAAFKGTSGWTGAKWSGKEKAAVESVYGYFSNGSFVNSLDELQAGTFPQANKEYRTYLKIHFPTSNSVVINSGPYDNRTIIQNMEKNEQWALRYFCANKSSANDGLRVGLCECSYNTSSQSYDITESKIRFSEFKADDKYPDYLFATVTDANYSKAEFKKQSKVRLALSADAGTTVYLQDISLFKASFNGDVLITPNNQTDSIESRVVDTTYYYFKADAIETIKEADELVPETISKTLLYNEFTPVYNLGAEKIRTVSAKESNYFNILQSIAETFEGWLSLKISREADGAIAKKEVVFKNYIGNNNYAGFRHGVNLKGIKRTFESKKIVSKLIVKQNSNEFAKNGFCTIVRAPSNPIGENYIYDFQYYFNNGLMSARDFLETNYVINENSKGKDLNSSDTEFTLQGYFPRLRQLNNKIDNKSAILTEISQDLVQYNANLQVAQAGYEAASSGIEEIQAQFYELTGQSIDNAFDSTLAQRSDIKKILQQYATHKEEESKYTKDKALYEKNTNDTQKAYDDLYAEIQTLLEWKSKLNQLFFKHYARFIQEGTWNNEEYVDDEKYYDDALSVMYNSCYPQVAYTIDVTEVSTRPGYELFAFNLGDKTYVEDADFFGSDYHTEVVVTEIQESLEDLTKNKIKVQNFKNQFQDLFQKITATVQQVQYSTGSYEKAVALAEAKQERKQQFLADALSGAQARLTTAGQQSVDWGDDGITVKSVNSPCDAIRLVGGAILLSKQDKNGQQKWTTGITSDGISASLLTSGILQTNEIQIMNSGDPTFRWDSFGISAFDATWLDGVISGVNYNKFVRFDRNGLYGITGVNGLNWSATDGDSINQHATFALTWSGLKVTGADKAIVNIGKNYLDSQLQTYNIISVKNKYGEDTFTVDSDGNVKVRGDVEIGALDDKMDASVDGTFSWLFSRDSGIKMWSGSQNSDDNIVFKVDKNGLYLRGSGEFTGNLSASSWSSNNFTVDTSGNVNANYIVATGGIIGGCVIDPTKGLLVSAAHIDGKLTAKEIDVDSLNIPGDAYIKSLAASQITAEKIEGLGCDFTSGSIGGWEITGFGIFSGDAGVGDADGGSYRFYAGSSTPSVAPFRVDGSGNLHAGTIETSNSITSLTNTGYTQVSSSGISLVYNPSGVQGVSCSISAHGFSSSIQNTGNAFECDITSTAYTTAYIGWSGGSGIVFGKDEGYFSGTWEIPSAIATTSDINKKHSIIDIPDAYRTIFANLKPKIYKYNDGKSDRYHVGFIAQDVEEAIIGAGLTTQDFAGFVRAQLPNEETGEPEDVCMLRYEEFIALNTLEIQKILPRLHELENEVTNLKEEISMLHQKLNPSEI